MCIRDSSYSNSWGAPRSEGRSHQGIDIFAAKGTPVVAAGDGTIVRINIGQRAGRYIVIRHDDGWESLYLHLNNDTPGTDDGLSNASVPGIVVGARVQAGELLDYVGDSGNAEETPPHLHFEMHRPDGTPTNPYPHLRAAQSIDGGITQAVPAPRAAAPAYVADNVVFVGNLDPGGGFAADIAVHGNTAYLGTWGRPDACPGFGVRLIDVESPLMPELIGSIASSEEYPGTSTDSVWVGAFESSAFTGDLAVVTLRLCDTSEPGRKADSFRGLAFYDVTDPESPTLLGEISSGPMTQGYHEVDVMVRSDGTITAAGTVLQSLPHTAGDLGDVRMIDITDPASPRAVADWDLRRDGPFEALDRLESEAYDNLELHSHSATWSHKGEFLWIANWDAGITVLDTSNLGSPQILNVFGYDGPSGGNAHSVAIDEERQLLVRNDQDLVNADYERHGAGWGGQRIYDVANPTAVAEVGAFRTERSMANDDGTALHVDGRYSAHNAVIADGIEYAAWYSDGVRIVDLSDPTKPREVAAFVPPAAADPQGYWDAPDNTVAFAMVWGVDVVDHLIYVSDMNTGLWIVRYGASAMPDELERQ